MKKESDYTYSGALYFNQCEQFDGILNELKNSNLAKITFGKHINKGLLIRTCWSDFSVSFLNHISQPERIDIAREIMDLYYNQKSVRAINSGLAPKNEIESFHRVHGWLKYLCRDNLKQSHVLSYSFSLFYNTYSKLEDIDSRWEFLKGLLKKYRILASI
jgi:hypothetical protein